MTDLAESAFAPVRGILSAGRETCGRYLALIQAAESAELTRDYPLMAELAGQASDLMDRLERSTRLSPDLHQALASHDGPLARELREDLAALDRDARLAAREIAGFLQRLREHREGLLRALSGLVTTAPGRGFRGPAPLPSRFDRTG